MKTKTVSVDTLYAKFAHRLAHVAGLSAAGYERTAGGLAQLTRDVANRLSPTDPNADWLEEISDNFSAVSRTGADGRDAQRLLKINRNTLYEALEDLETY